MLKVITDANLNVWLQGLANGTSSKSESSDLEEVCADFLSFANNQNDMLLVLI